MEAPFPYFGEFLSLATAVSWAGSVILFRKSGETAHPVALNLFKSVVGLLLFLPTLLLMSVPLVPDLAPEDFVIVAVSGVLGLGLSDSMFFKALNLMGAGLNAVLDCFYPAVVTGLSILWLGESLSGLQFFGIGLITLAVVAVSADRNMKPVPRKDLLLGAALSWGAMILVGVSLVMVKPILDRAPVLWVTSYRMAAGVLSIAVTLLCFPRRVELLRSLLKPAGWRFILPASIVGAYFTMLIWLTGVAYTEASVASTINQTSTIFIVLFAALFLDERLTPARIIGTVLGFAGALVVTFG